MNMNISIDLDMLPGARIMDIQGKTCTKQCIVIPIDNKIGTVCDGYTTKDPQTGLPTEKFFSHVKLNLVAVEHRTKKHGISHGLKPSFSQEKTERMTEEQMYELLATDGMLVKRPLLVAESFVLIGFKESEWAEKTG